MTLREAVLRSLRRTRRGFLVLALWGLWPAAALEAQDPVPADSVIALGELIVSALRAPTSVRDVPVNVTTVTREELRLSAAQTLQDVLQEVPGLNFPLPVSGWCRASLLAGRDPAGIGGHRRQPHARARRRRPAERPVLRLGALEPGAGGGHRAHRDRAGRRHRQLGQPEPRGRRPRDHALGWRRRVLRGRTGREPVHLPRRRGGVLRRRPRRRLRGGRSSSTAAATS